MLLDVLEIVLLQSSVLLAAAGVIIQLSSISRRTRWKSFGYPGGTQVKHKVPRHIHWAANTLRKYLVTLPILFFVYYLSGLVLIGFILGGVIVQVDNNALKLFAFMWHFLIMCVLVWMLALVVWIYRT